MRELIRISLDVSDVGPELDHHGDASYRVSHKRFELGDEGCAVRFDHAHEDLRACEGYRIAPLDDARPRVVPFASTASRMRPIRRFSFAGSTVTVT